ncbi:hypothetical protein [Chryseobacterium sp. JV558]|nr:hypothetical protein [Chryseobacterium sp. JV558]
MKSIGLDSYGMTNCVDMQNGIFLFTKNMNEKKECRSADVSSNIK